MEADVLRVPAGPGSLHVERYGHGTSAIVLLHGFAGYSFTWRNVAPRLAAANYTAYSIDMLGYGESDRPGGAAYGLAAQAEYLERAMTAMRIRHAVVAGIDIGAAVAMILASRHSDRVDRLVLINPVAFEEVPGREVKEMQRRTLRLAMRLTRSVLGAAPLLTPFLCRAVADPERMPPALQARYIAPYAGRDGAHHLLVLARSLRKQDLDELDLRAVRASTLVLWGEQDPWLDAKLGERLINAIPDGRLVKLSRSSRLVPEEEPAALAEHIVRFAAGKGHF